MVDDRASNSPKRRILAIDDSQDDLRLLCKILAARGHQVHPATTSVAALQFLESRATDLILLDVVMPQMSGYDLCRQIKANSRTCDIPIIFISGNDDSMDKVKAFSAGGVDYIVKPFRHDEVIARIDTHLLLRALQQNLTQQVQWRTAELAASNVSLQAEIAQHESAKKALSLSEERFRALYHYTPSMYLMVDPAGRLRLINRFGLMQLGYASDDVVDRPVLNLIHPDDKALAVAQMQRCIDSREHVFHWELRVIRKDGSVIWTKQTGQSVFEPDGSMVLLMVCEDITERKNAEERVHYLAHHDPLTGLPNRSLMEDRVQQSISQAQRLQLSLAMLFLDLDGFKHINDSLGHPVGDALLCAVAARLRGCLRDGDTIARLGGDEFIVILPAPTDSQNAAEVAQNLLRALDADFAVGDHCLHITGSIGIGMYPDDGPTSAALLRSADTAMYHAKGRGRNNYQFFTGALNEAAQQRRSTEVLLRKALQENEFELYYQPQVHLDTGVISSAEALLRWRRPGKSPISCVDFIAVAEESGLVVPIGLWVLQQACVQLAQWRLHEFPGMRIAVNISARQFFQPQFYETIMQVLHENGLPPEALELEITEGVFVKNNEENVGLLNKLRAAGIQLSLDDFGTGYSSLSYLQRFRVDALKIDRSFINGIGQYDSQTALVTAIIAMGRSLRLNVIAEGVERSDQADFLKAHGCLIAQGFHYAAPMPASAFTDLLRNVPHGVNGLSRQTDMPAAWPLPSVPCVPNTPR
jgi:diguanylate cyclase (GGDEF)-like protein/PAS domain S-box-containing protein